MREMYILPAVLDDGKQGYVLMAPGSKFCPPRSVCFNESRAVVEAAKKHLEST